MFGPKPSSGGQGSACQCLTHLQLHSHIYYKPLFLIILFSIRTCVLFLVSLDTGSSLAFNWQLFQCNLFPLSHCFGGNYGLITVNQTHLTRCVRCFETRTSLAMFIWSESIRSFKSSFSPVWPKGKLILYHHVYPTADECKLTFLCVSP